MNPSPHIIINPQPKYPKPNHRHTIADNLIQLSNIQYLLKHINFIEHDPQQIFEKCLTKTKDQQQLKMIQLSVKNKLDIVGYKQFDDIVEYKQFDDTIHYQQFVNKNNKQSLYDNFIDKQIKKSLSITKPTRPLSKQQLLHMGYTKITQQKQKQQKQISRSRRSFQYIQSLKQKISATINKQQQQSQIVSGQLTMMEIKQILCQLSKLQKQRYYFKMQLYQLQKFQSYQNQVNNDNKNKQIMRQRQLYRMFHQNLSKARQLYNYSMSQSKISISTKSVLLNNINKDSHIYNTKQMENIKQLEKCLNSILLDQRQLYLLYEEIQS